MIPKFAEKEIFTSPSTESTNFSSVWYQQDGVTTHTATRVLEWLENTFSGRYLSHRTEKPWPPHSPVGDLNPMDFFLWGYLKDRVYTDNLDGVKELKNNIKREIRQISTETCKVYTHLSLKVIQEKGKHLRLSLPWKRKWSVFDILDFEYQFWISVD
jgi:hypothetical protein